ncbi:hypothetical protein CAEBREN_16436 [Caenorhabditis brenneri]|uniref:Uncharacterized protein n=1 Tax=Caenorhabditis brenneri TaxID=135651 RepID=G0PBE4_CAEBE|nr:hypothetical protein CAEBREN_16436 [Caenorhabditis brenneri]
MVLPTMARPKSPFKTGIHYSKELKADLLKHFENGFGYISREGKREISKKYGLRNERITNWSSLRRIHHGVFGEKQLLKKAQVFQRDPSFPKAVEFVNALVECVKTIVRMHARFVALMV